VGRQADAVTAPQQFKDHHEQRVDGSRVKAHLQFLDHDPIDLVAPRNLGWRHQPVESHQ